MIVKGGRIRREEDINRREIEKGRWRIEGRGDVDACEDEGWRFHLRRRRSKFCGDPRIRRPDTQR